MNQPKKPHTKIKDLLRGKQLGFVLPLVILIAVVLIIAGGVGYYFYKTLQEEKEEVSVPEEQVDFTKDKLFFVTNLIKDKNLYMTNKFGEDKVQLTNYPGPVGTEVLPSLKYAQVIDNKYLGYYRCDVKPGDFNCRVYRVNIDSRTPEELMVGDQNELMDSLAFFDKNIFAYLSLGEKFAGLYLFKNERKTLIKEIEIYEGGRGGTIEDSIKLSFSPDGTQILHIATGLRAFFDFNVYIYDLNGNELAKIEDATQPDWIDNERIIFRRPGEGLHIFDVSSKEEKYCETGKKAYHPQVLSNFQKVVYWTWDREKEDDKGSVWLLDLKSCKGEKLSDSSSRPLWISEREILISNNKEIDERGKSWAISMLVFDIFTKEKYQLFNIEKMGEGWHAFVSPLVNGGGHDIFFFQESL